MDRRKFIRNAALCTTPLLLKGMPLFASGTTGNPFFDALARTTNACGKILVIIQLNGGNDGLNMVIPLDKYTELNNARSGIMIPAASVLPLTGTNATGLHPSMTGLQNLYNNGKLTIVQGVTYPNPDYSHFRATDIWFSGSASNQYWDTGWIGRDFDISYPGYPNGYPNTGNLDPLAIQIGGTLPLSLQGPNINMGYNVPNPASLLNVINAVPQAAPVSDYGTELTFLRQMKDQSNAYTTRITNAYNAQATQSSMYATSGNSLSDQLKIVARLIGGGLTTQVYIVNHSDSFDTHVDQVVSGATTTGWHANNLSKLSVAITAFQDDITLMGKDNNVTGMTFSEFGRRVISNASNGTDHGAGAPVLFFGSKLNGGLIGVSPNIPATATTNTQVNMQFDFRQVYATVMQNWLCMSAAQSQTVLGSNFNTLSIFNGTALPLTGIHLSAAWTGNAARLTWQVQNNDSYERYVIERSADAIHFSTAGQVTDLYYGDTATYVFEDSSMADDMFYRIIGVTRQQSQQLSNIAEVRTGNNKVQQLSIYPNPVTDHVLHVHFFKTPSTDVELCIYDMRGEKLFYNKYSNAGTLISVRLPDIFETESIYLVRVLFDYTSADEKISFA